jgi:ferric-dicitrate binding protein FerR (iron transport regulator)
MSRVRLRQDWLIELLWALVIALVVWWLTHHIPLDSFQADKRTCRSMPNAELIEYADGSWICIVEQRSPTQIAT